MAEASQFQCVTCKQDLPKDARIAYFAHYGSTGDTHELHRYLEEVRTLVRHAYSASLVFTEAGDIDDELPDHLVSLMRDLIEECLRRLALVFNVADCWYEQLHPKPCREEGLGGHTPLKPR